MYDILFKNLTQIKLYHIIILAISYRLLIYFYFSFNPLFHANYGVVSPSNFQEFADFIFHNNFNQLFNTESNYFLKFLETYTNLFKFNFEYNYDERFAGPLFPIIIYITNYGPNNPIYLS